MWIRETGLTDEETDRVCPGGTPTSLLRESNWVLKLRGEKHLEVYTIYFAQATSNPAFPYLLKLCMTAFLKLPHSVSAMLH